MDFNVKMITKMSISLHYTFLLIKYIFIFLEKAVLVLVFMEIIVINSVHKIVRSVDVTSLVESA